MAGESDDLARWDSLHDASHGVSIPGYELRERLGRGAFGEVWSALQERTGQAVAVKMFPRAGRDLDPLRHEVERLGQVARHPHVVGLLDADLDHDPPYLVTPMLSGSLVGRTAAPASDVGEVARWFEQVVWALQYIHGKGILHCDIKPANVLLDEEGAARVSDFGQAHLLAQPGASLGTLGYMAPEQIATALGEGGLPDVSWDVYSVGAMVYHLLTGRVPRSGPEADPGAGGGAGARSRLREFRDRVTRRPLVPVRTLNRRVDRDLAEIVEHCLALSPEGRYRSMGEIAEDLRRRSRLLPLMARRPTVSYVLLRFLRRNRWPVGIAGLALLALATVLAVTYLRTRAALAEATFMKGVSERQGEHPAQALLSYCSAARDGPKVTRYRAAASGLLLHHPGAIQSYVHRFRQLRQLAFSPVGDRVLVLKSESAVTLWTADGLVSVASLKHSAPVVSAAFSPDGSCLAAWTEDDRIHLWDSREGSSLWETPASASPIRAMAVGADAVVAGSADGTVTEFSLDGGARGRRWRTASAVTALDRAPGGLVCAGHSDGAVDLLADGREPRRLEGHDGTVARVSFSRDGTRVLSVARDQTARLWAVDGAGPPPVVVRHEGLAAAALGPDGRRIATAGGREVRLWEAGTGAPIGRPVLHPTTVDSAAFSSDGRLLVTVDQTETVRFWHASTGHPALLPLFQKASHAAFSPGGDRLLTGSTSYGYLTLWDLSRTRLLPSPLLHDAAVVDAHFSADGGRVATASRDGSARVWDGRDGTPLTPPLVHGGQVNSSRLRPDGKLLLTASDDGTARLWDAGSGEPVSRVVDVDGEVSEAAFSPGGDRVAAATSEGKAHVVDVSRPRAPKPLFVVSTGAAAGGVRFSPDGSRLLTRAGDFARLWDAADGDPVTPPLGHGDSEVLSDCFSPDGMTVATGATDFCLRLWDATSGALLDGPRQQYQWVLGLSFDPAGRRLLIVDNATVKIWDLEAGRVLRLATFRPMAMASAAAFNPGGELVLTAVGPEARLQDAETGTVLAAPFVHDDVILKVGFSPDGGRAVTCSLDGTARLWPLGADADIPVEQLDLEVRCWMGEAVYGKALAGDAYLRAQWDQWRALAERHARECRFPEFNLYRRLDEAGLLQALGGPMDPGKP